MEPGHPPITDNSENRPLAAGDVHMKKLYYTHISRVLNHLKRLSDPRLPAVELKVTEDQRKLQEEEKRFDRNEIDLDSFMYVTMWPDIESEIDTTECLDMKLKIIEDPNIIEVPKRTTKALPISDHIFWEPAAVAVKALVTSLQEGSVSEEILSSWQGGLHEYATTVFGLLTYHCGALQYYPSIRGTVDLEGFEELIEFMSLSLDHENWQEIWNTGICRQAQKQQIKSFEEFTSSFKQGKEHIKKCLDEYLSCVTDHQLHSPEER